MLELARSPESIHGFGHVKKASVLKARASETVLMAKLQHEMEAGGTAQHVRYGTL